MSVDSSVPFILSSIVPSSQYFDCECHYRTLCFHPCVLFHEFHDKDEGDFYGKHRVYDEFVREARKDPDLRSRMVVFPPTCGS